MKRLLRVMFAATLAFSMPFIAQAQCEVPDNQGETWGNCDDCEEYEIDINIWMPDPNGNGVQDMKTAFETAVDKMNECLNDGVDGPKLVANVSSNPDGGDADVHIYPWVSGNDCGVNNGKAGDGDSLIRLYSASPSADCPRTDLTYSIHELLHSMGHGAHSGCPYSLMNEHPALNFSDVPGALCAAIARQWVNPAEPDENEELGGPISPLVLDMDGDGISTSSVHRDPVIFDLDGDGSFEEVGWTSRSTQDAFLWIDLNGDGTPNSGAELFGNASVLPGGGEADNGIAALAVYDSNLDGRITAEDDVWPRLQLWNDRNHNGRSSRNEITHLSATRIVGISLKARSRRWTDENGNIHTHSSTYWVQGRGRLERRLIEDIWFLWLEPTR